MKPLLLALLLCAACKHATSSLSTEHTETSSVTDTTSEEHGTQTTTTVVTEAPGETTTTVSEYGPPEKEAAPEEAAPDAGTLVGDAALARSTVPRHGPLVKRTVTVVKSGGETTQSTQQTSTQGTAASETKAQASGDTKAQAQSASAPSAGCIGASWLWGLAALAFAGLLIVGAIKMRKAV